MRVDRVIHWFRVLFIRAAAVVIVLGAGQYVLNVDSRSQMGNMHGELDRMRELNRDLAANNERLRLQIEGVQHDDRYLEQVARHEFGMIRKGEVLYKFVDE